MAKRRSSSGKKPPPGGLPPAPLASAKPTHGSPWAWVWLAALLVYLGICYLLLPDELAGWLQKLIGLGAAGLALAVLLAATALREPADEMLMRLQRGQHLDFGKQLRMERRKRKTVQLPVVGQVSARALAGTGLFVVVFAWWFTPLAPIRVKERAVLDLSEPLSAHILALAFTMPDAQLTVPQVPSMPSSAVQLSAYIREESGVYPQAWKALAERRFDDADRLFQQAEKAEGVEPVKARVGRGLNGLYARRFSEAVEAYRAALELKPDDPLLLLQAAVASIHAGSFAEAEPLTQKAWQVCQADPDTEATVLASAAHIRSAVYTGLGRDYDLAEQLNKQAQNTWTEELDAEHPLVAASLNNQAAMFQLLAKYPGSLELNNWAREIWSLEEEGSRPAVAVSLGNTATLQSVLGNYAEAEALHRQSMAIDREVLPAGHPTLLLAQCAEAIATLARGQYEEARALTRGLVVQVEEELGPNHAGVAAALNASAEALTAAAQYAQAEPYYLRAVSVSKRSLGAAHPYVAHSLNNLAALYLVQQRYDEASKTAETAAKVIADTLGDQHPITARSLQIRANVLAAKDRAHEARPLLEKALKIWKDTVGDEHPQVAQTLADLAALDDSPSTYERGIAQFEKALEMGRKLLGPEHPSVAEIEFRLARLHMKRGMFEEADPLLKQVMTVRKKTLVDYHPDIAQTMEAYAQLLQEKTPADPERAKSLLARAQAMREEHAAHDRP